LLSLTHTRHSIVWLLASPNWGRDHEHTETKWTEAI
jgi:hypothetical protein